MSPAERECQALSTTEARLAWDNKGFLLGSKTWKLVVMKALGGIVATSLIVELRLWLWAWHAKGERWPSKMDKSKCIVKALDEPTQ